MIYERFPQLHGLSAEDKATLGKELLDEASRQKASPSAPVQPLQSRRREPDWKQKAREASQPRQPN